MERESGVSEFWKILRDLSEDERQKLKRVTFVFAPAYIRESGENPEFMKVRKRSYEDVVDTMYRGDLVPAFIYILSFLRLRAEARTEKERLRRTAQGIHCGMAETESQGGGGTEEIEGSRLQKQSYRWIHIFVML